MFIDPINIISYVYNSNSIRSNCNTTYHQSKLYYDINVTFTIDSQYVPMNHMSSSSSSSSTGIYSNSNEFDGWIIISSNTTTTTNWMTSVYNNVQTLYTNDAITTALKSGVFVAGLFLICGFSPLRAPILNLLGNFIGSKK